MATHTQETKKNEDLDSRVRVIKGVKKSKLFQENVLAFCNQYQMTNETSLQ